MYSFPHKALLVRLPILLFFIIETNGNRYELNEDNWKLMLKNEWMVQFIAPWCPSCKIVAPIWERFEKVSEKFNVNVGTVDITKSPALSGRFFVTRLPSIYHVIDGKFRYYRGQRDIDALTDFIKLKQWKEVAPISRWNDPNAYHMGILSYFFRISLILKEWNARLQYELGFSAYSSYGIFVLGTILIGLVFGLLLITLLDFICPSKKRRDFVEIKKTLAGHNEEIKEISAKDDIDDLAEEKSDKNFNDNDSKDSDETRNESFVDANLTYETQTNDAFIIAEDEDQESDDIDDIDDMFDENFVYQDSMNATRKRYTI